MKRVAWILSALLAVTYIPSIAASPPKTGQACSKMGLVQTYKGKKFSCIKSGKKLVWNKGIPLTSNKSAASASPTIAPLPSASPSIAASPAPSSPSVSPKATQTSVQISGSPEQVIAYENMKKAMTPQPVQQLFRFHYSPNAVKSFKDFLESELAYAMTYWTSVYNNPKLFNVFYGTEKDMEWLIEAWKPYGFDRNVGFANDFRGRIQREGNRLNAGAVPSQSEESHLSILRHSSLPTDFGTFLPHENVHIVQQFISKNRTGQMPCWLREGSANLFGNFIFAEKYGVNLYSLAKRGDMNNYLGGSSGVEIRKFSEAEWFAHLKSLEGNFQGGCDYIYRFAYGSGLLLSEKLMAEGGFNKMMDFWQAFSQEKDWRISFKEIYGIELDTWYRSNAIPYLMREYARVGS